MAQKRLNVTRTTETTNRQQFGGQYAGEQAQVHCSAHVGKSYDNARYEYFAFRVYDGPRTYEVSCYMEEGSLELMHAEIGKTVERLKAAKEGTIDKTAA